jgi:hypothetical protein
MSTIRIPIGEGDYLWLELSGRSCLRKPGSSFPFLTKVLQLLLEKAFPALRQKKDPFTGLLQPGLFFSTGEEKLTGASRQGKLFPTTFI